MKPLILLDNGHGCDTAGKCSPVWADDSQLFEYEFNRDIVARISRKLDRLGIDNLILVPESRDISLPDRVRRVNAHSNAILVSVHANAGGGTGFEAYTTKGHTPSDAIATVLLEEAAKMFPEFRLRTDILDGDPDKEENFYMLKSTSCPAVLTENLFMDTEKDCKVLMSEDGRNRIATYHVNAIKKILESWHGTL